MGFSTSGDQTNAKCRVGSDEGNVVAIKALYVYEAPVRIWHWINAAAIIVLAVTGYLVGSPISTSPGEASAHFGMDYIRFLHFSAAYAFAIGMLLRIYWAFLGNRHAHEMFYVPIFSREYWKDFASMLRWYAFLSKRPNRYIGHNPLARFAMFFVFVLASIFMMLTGFALYGEGEQGGSWQDRLFGRVVPLLGEPQSVHTWHHLGMWAITAFVILHIYTAVREDIMGRQSVVSTMVSGYRTFKD
ncbi:hydrogenase 1, b-type cytochrome subunit [Paraburkholderia ribeironis]|uniref:Hydrogenase 1, b-type cytochrome subunit n=1 Tax=Paraburkholderia ribeironis TaxID=1247936 RepID=A0A1N7RSZ5_9BURK|nr:Ni/Fe-hydrogenase, b-type cytochrome subunit [Paraburkholderia ribeironis]SIT38233.1 hydrogenase 1, b-type cytochrome subunit [Paraburkholderia ribeironis]